VVFGMVSLINPGFISPMMETRAGPFLLMFAALSVMLGYWWMMKIADIDI